MKASSIWERDNLVLFPGNSTHNTGAGDFKVKEEEEAASNTMKHDSGGFFRAQSGECGRSPSPAGNRTVDANGEQHQKNGVVTVAVPAGSGDSGIGLKLGKRTYFEAVRTIPAPVHSTPASISQGKKARSVMHGTQVPRCQVEGCKADLSGVKEYHRRHKVCELHSKSPKVVVAGIEQRFCQQCSRFHVLSEFDEGKRSCRRRLAGHNQRRRKPQPDSMAINSARFASPFYDDRRFASIWMDRSPFMHSRLSSSSILEDSMDFKLGYGKGPWPRVVKTEDQTPFDGQVTTGALSRYNADKLLFLLQSSNKGNLPVGATAMNQDINQYMQSSGGHVGQALTLSSSTSGEDLAGLSVASATLSGVSDSGCALSLLSSNSWTSRAPGSASFDHMATRSGVTTMDQLIQEHQAQPLMAQPLMQQHQGVQHNFGLVSADKMLTISPSNGFPVNSMGKGHQGEPLVGGIGNYEGHVFGLLHGENFRASQPATSQDIERTMDLMHRSSTNDNHTEAGMVHQQSRHFNDSQLMRSFQSSVYDTHQML